ncbi:50S ribosomal protein L11 methyltransferase [Bacteroides sp. OttesenSCG-928-F21]|nr:50S ribosomal protein L11 methyltransferase [Bacteroides sp. OttesenSCG-928-F21]
MKYLEFTFHTTPCTETTNDVLSAVLAEIGFDSFVENEGGIIAYILQDQFDESTLQEALANFPIENTGVRYTYEEAEDKNWNEEWEKHYFQPIIVDERCVIHSTFHRNIPAMEYDIVINPQMSFGTGHHETTHLIISELLQADLEGKSLLDMGCGTSILAILARMRGAKPITAIDIDSWCVENSIENIALNRVTDIEVELGDAAILEGRKPFDVIIANINRNILLADMKHYVQCMNAGAILYMSGFYTDDIPMIKEEAANNGLRFVHYRDRNNWAAVKFEKPAL